MYYRENCLCGSEIGFESNEQCNEADQNSIR